MVRWRGRLIGRFKVVGATREAPFRNHFGSSSGRIKNRERAVGPGEKAFQASRDYLESFFARSAALEQYPQFVDLCDLSCLTAGMIEKAGDSFMGNRHLLLCSLALRDFLILMVLGESQSEGECEKRCHNHHVRDRS